MKAVFKGYKQAGVLEFTVGKIYDLVTDTVTNGYAEVIDDNKFRGTLIPGDIYDFEVVTPDEVSCYCETMVGVTLNKPEIDKKQFKYYINGDAVTKCKFDDVLLCVNDFKNDGIDTSSIKFEVKFE